LPVIDGFRRPALLPGRERCGLRALEAGLRTSTRAPHEWLGWCKHPVMRRERSSLDHVLRWLPNPRWEWASCARMTPASNWWRLRADPGRLPSASWRGDPRTNVLETHLGAGELERPLDPATAVPGWTSRGVWLVEGAMRSDRVLVVLDRSGSLPRPFRSGRSTTGAPR
jgi:hypothetical protein